MAVQLTPSQEQRIQAIIHSGAYQSVDDVVDAALAAVEQGTHPDFEGTEAELETLLLAGLDSAEISEKDFWLDVDRETDTLLANPRA